MILPLSATWYGADSGLWRHVAASNRRAAGSGKKCQDAKNSTTQKVKVLHNDAMISKCSPMQMVGKQVIRGRRRRRNLQIYAPSSVRKTNRNWSVIKKQNRNVNISLGITFLVYNFLHTHWLISLHS